MKQILKKLVAAFEKTINPTKPHIYGNEEEFNLALQSIASKQMAIEVIKLMTAKVEHLEKLSASTVSFSKSLQQSAQETSASMHESFDSYAAQFSDFDCENLEAVLKQQRTAIDNVTSGMIAHYEQVETQLNAPKFDMINLICARQLLIAAKFGIEVPDVEEKPSQKRVLCCS